MDASRELDELLSRFQAGDLSAEAAFVEAVYDQLVGIARSLIHKSAIEKADLGIEPAEIVHELLLRLHASGLGAFRNSEDFEAYVTVAMKGILRDSWHHRKVRKRGEETLFSIDEAVEIVQSAQEFESTAANRVALREALTELAEKSPRSARAILLNMRGFKRREIAEELGIHPAAVARHLRMGRQILRNTLGTSQKGFHPALSQDSSDSAGERQKQKTPPLGQAASILQRCAIEVAGLAQRVNNLRDAMDKSAAQLDGASKWP